MLKYILLFIGFLLFVAFSSTKTPTLYPFPELKFFPSMPQSAQNPVTIEGAVLGKYLFYDPILSLNNSISCATCHQQINAFSDFKDNQLNKKRSTLPLFNLAWYKSFFWDGRASSIEEQVFHPLRDKNEMNLQWTEAVKRINNETFYKKKFELAFGKQEIDSILIAKAIGQFLRTLLSYQSKFDRVLAGNDFLTRDEYEGLVLMNDMTKGDCLHCHSTDADVLGTLGGFSNNGLELGNDLAVYRDKGLGGFTKNISDYGKFKIPSLRNLLFTAPYMHDGRFATLEEVLDFYSEGVKVNSNIDTKMEHAYKGGVNLTNDEKQKILSFLRTLTDSTFIYNQEFSNPFLY